MDTELDYLAHLAQESARFSEAIDGAAPGEPVSSCPGWTADDLLWHLGWVQWWWGAIVRDGLSGPAARELIPERPADRAGLQAFYQRASPELARILSAAAPDTPAWTWSSDHTVGFIRRTQAHEALIHRIDAELAAGDRTPMDPLLGADGVDEVLRVMYAGPLPEWSSFTPDAGRTLRIRATDTGDTWLMSLGRFTGTDADGTSYDEPDFQVAARDSGESPSALIGAAAADLDCWLWHRPPAGPVERAGDRQALAQFELAIASGLD